MAFRFLDKLVVGGVEYTFTIPDILKNPVLQWLDAKSGNIGNSESLRVLQQNDDIRNYTITQSPLQADKSGAPSSLTTYTIGIGTLELGYSGGVICYSFIDSSNNTINGVTNMVNNDNGGYCLVALVDDTYQIGILGYFVTAYRLSGDNYINFAIYGVSTNYDKGYQVLMGALPSLTANGGGATHIAKVTGQLKDLSSNLSDILMVSGGGGGGLIVGETAYTGKEAGGISGSGDNSADQSTGNAFGLGESGTNLSGGGSGLYGGYKGTSSKSGGAGSGYIGNSLLSNKKMVGYNVPTSSATGTKTESVEVFDSNYVANKPKAGNGHVRIKFLRNSNPVVLLSYADGIKHEILDSYVDYSQEGSSYSWEFSDSSSNPELYNQGSAGNCEIKFTTPLQRYKATKMYVFIRTFTGNISWRGVLVAFYKNLDLFPQTGKHRNDSWFNFNFAMYDSENIGSGYLCDQATEAGCVYPIITPQMRIEIDISSMPSDQTFYLGFWKCNLGSYIQEISFNDEILILEE